MARILLGAFLAMFALAAVVISARAEPVNAVRLRVMVFNIWYGGDQVSFPAIVEAIKKADADIIGVGEPDGNLSRLAQEAGYPFYDTRRNIISRYPIFDSGSGQRTETGPGAYSVVGLNSNALHAWVMVRPGKVVAVNNTHLSSDPYGPEAVRDGKDLKSVLALEERSRLREAQALLAMGALAKTGVPTFLTGDFNSPAPSDWSAAAQKARRDVIRYPVSWPAIRAILDSGLRDSYREAHPDAVAKPGFTWTAGMPHPFIRPRETMDRIDYVFAGGPVRTVASEIVGEQSGPDVDISVSPWPSDHRAVVSTFDATPVNAPALISVHPRRVLQGELFLVRGYDPASELLDLRIAPAGAPASAARLAVVDEIAPWRRTSRFSSAELAPGEYDAILLGRNGAELKRTRFAIVAPEATPSLSALTPSIVKGGAIKARWENAPGYRFDWIGVFKAGDSGIAAYLTSEYTGARFNGEAEIPARTKEGPLPAGNYELRLMLDDSQTILARTPFSIKAK
jgi:endonuclease/exonuclease/phosphatase family metal-dependent hydrolase